MKNKQDLWLQNVNKYLSLIINNDVYRQSKDNIIPFFYEMVDYYEDKTIDLYLSQLLDCDRINKDICDKIQLLSDNFIVAEKLYQASVPEEFWEKQKSIALEILAKLES